MATAEVAMRLDDRQRFGLVDLGPGALEFAAQMDASAGRALTTARTDAAESAGSGRGAIAAVGPIALGAEPGFNAMVVWALLITSLDDFARAGAQSGTVEDEPETIEVAGNTGTIKTTLTLKVVTSGSRLSVDVTMKSKGKVVDKQTGAILYAIDSIASGHVVIDFCPDAGGQAAASIKLTSSEIYTQGGGGSKGVSKEFSGNAAITVDDEANISKVEGASEGAEEAGEGVTDAAGQGDPLTTTTRTASDNIANDGDGNRLPGVARNIQLGGEGTTSDQQVKLWGSTIFFVETMLTAAAKEAEKLWREGKCVELTVDPDGGDVSPNEIESVTATLKHKIDGTELDKPVVATLTGVATLDPAGEKQPAPATVTYTAGPDDGDYGRINFKSTSNRGIAEKSVTFTVRPAAWTTNADTPLGEIRGLKCDGVGGEWTVEGDEVLQVLTVTTLWTITIDETTLSGTYHHHKVQEGLGTVTTSDSRGNARVVLNEDGSVMMTLDPAPITLVTRNSFGGSGTVTTPGDGRIFLWQREAGVACP